MKPKITGFIFLMLLNGASCCAEETGVLVSLNTEKKEFQLEDRVVLYFDIENHTSNVISFEIGYGRDNSFVFATTKCPIGSGQQLDPYYEFGGLVPINQVKSKEKYRRAVMPDKYLDLSKLGHYELKCTLTFDITNKSGVKEDFKKEFVVEFDIVDNPTSVPTEKNSAKEKEIGQPQTKDATDKVKDVKP